MSLLKKLLKYKNSRFFRSVIVVASGTAMAQLITMAFSPVITRLYGPEAFGVLGTFVAFTHILSPLAGLTYPAAIVLPKEDSEAECLVRLSRNISFFIAIAILILLLFQNNFIIDILNLEGIGNFIYFSFQERHFKIIAFKILGFFILLFFLDFYFPEYKGP